MTLSSVIKVVDDSIPPHDKNELQFHFNKCFLFFPGTRRPAHKIKNITRVDRKKKVDGVEPIQEKEMSHRA